MIYFYLVFLYFSFSLNFSKFISKDKLNVAEQFYISDISRTPHEYIVLIISLY